MEKTLFGTLSGVSFKAIAKRPIMSDLKRKAVSPSSSGLVRNRTGGCGGAVLESCRSPDILVVGFRPK